MAKNEIEERFNANLVRVRHLIKAYRQLTSGASGRPPVADADILRAAVVLLHATMEDLIRSVSDWKMKSPSASSISFKGVHFPGSDALKYSVEELCAYRGQSINDVIESATDQFLQGSNYNNSRQVGGALERVGLNPTPILAQFGAKIDSITSRRHLIVHRVDANPLKGSGHHPARSINPSTVEVWTSDIEGFGKAVLAAC